jgi:methylmalonyl-CoA/ethylmalonyl-CoA epimerase
VRLHHIAYVTKNVEHKADFFGRLLGFRVIAGPVVDQEQGVRVIFMGIGGEAKVELLEPIGPDSPVQRFLANGGGIYHLCFEVDDLDKTLERIIKEGHAMVVKEPVEAPAIDGKRVAFIVTAERDLIEFVESREQDRRI